MNSIAPCDPHSYITGYYWLKMGDYNGTQWMLARWNSRIENFTLFDEGDTNYPFIAEGCLIHKWTLVDMVPVQNPDEIRSLRGRG